jgi:hypothetical protein
MGAFTWSLRVTSPDRRAARVARRKRQFAVSRPLDFDVEHEGITALEYALGTFSNRPVNSMEIAFAKISCVAEAAARLRLDVPRCVRYSPDPVF